MSDAKGILDWFSKMKSGNVQTGSRGHAVAISDTVSELGLALSAMVAKDVPGALKAIDRMLLAEREADRIEDRLCLEITDGSLSNQEREDLLHLVRKSDEIADFANEAGIYIQMIIETETKVPAYLWEAAKQMSAELMLAVKMLVKGYDSLVGSVSEVRRCIESIKDQERIIDQMNYTIFKKILVSEMDYKGVMLMRGMISDIEQSSDACKKCADTMTILISTRST